MSKNIAVKSTMVGAIAIIAVLLIQGCSENSEPVSQVDSPAKPAAENQDTQDAVASESADAIDGALLAIGAKCDKSRRNRASCKWKNISYRVIKPANWEKEMAHFRAGCKSGALSADYNVVSDGESWIVTASNGGDPTTKMHAALLNQDGMTHGAELVRLCDL